MGLLYFNIEQNIKRGKELKKKALERELKEKAQEKESKKRKKKKISKPKSSFYGKITGGVYSKHKNRERSDPYNKFIKKTKASRQFPIPQNNLVFNTVKNRQAFGSDKPKFRNIFKMQWFTG